MSPEIAIVKADILESGLDDWVHIPEVLHFARQAFPGLSKPEALPIALEAIKSLVAEGAVEVGTIEGDRFVAWAGPTDEVLSRIDDAAKGARYPIVFGDLFWIQNTSLGDELGQAILDSRG